MKSWYEIYRDRMNDRYERHIREKYLPFINSIRSEFPDYTEYVELGCGAGNITKALREIHPGSFHALVDSCPKMLSLAIENNQSSKCHFICGDIVKYSYHSMHPEKTVVHSHGVLEHFNDEEIIQIIKMADYSATSQVHYVPSAKYETPSRGDERLMSANQWTKILKKLDGPSNRLGFEISEFNSGYDLIIKLNRR